MGKSTISMAIFNSYVKLPEVKKASHTILNNKILIIFFGLDWSLCKTVLSRETSFWRFQNSIVIPRTYPLHIADLF